MPILISTVEMSDLAKKLAKMRFNRAKGYVRRLDPHVRLDMLRVSVGQELHTRYALLTKGLWITLVETSQEVGNPSGFGYRRERYKYQEARVEAIPDHILQDKTLATTVGHN